MFEKFRSTKSDWALAAAKILFIAGVYCGLLWLGVRLHPSHESVSSLRLQIGFGLAMLVLWGPRCWPGIFFGSFLGCLSIHFTWQAAAVMALGNVFGLGVAALRIRQIAGGRQMFEQPMTIVNGMVLAGIGAGMAAGFNVLGAVWLIPGNQISWLGFFSLWLTSITSITLISPMILTWCNRPRPPWKLNQIGEAAGLMGLLLIFGVLVLNGNKGLPFLEHSEWLLGIPLIWAAMRFGAHGLTIATSLVFGMASWGVIHGRGPFALERSVQDMLAMQACVGSLGLLALSLLPLVTDLKSLQRAFAAKEDALRLALDASKAGLWSWDAKTNISSWDDNYHQMYGFTPSEPRTHEAWLSRVHPDDRDRLVARIQALLNPKAGNEWNEVFRAIIPDKGERWMSGIGRVERDAQGRAISFKGINLDVTERMINEVALLQSEANLAEAQQLAKLGSWSLDVATEKIHWSKGMFRVFEIDEANFANDFKAFVSKVVPEDRALLFAADGKARAEGKPFQIEYRIQAQAGGFKVIQAIGDVIKDAEGKVVKLIGTAQDITELRRMETELRQMNATLEERVTQRTAALMHTETRFGILFDNIRDGTFILDATNRRILEVNRAGLELYGYTREEMLRLTPMQLSENPEATEQNLERVRQGAPLERLVRMHRKKDGTIFPVEISHGSFEIGREQFFWAVIRNISERQKIERARQASEARYRSLAGSLPDAVIVLDRHSNYQFVNATAEKWMRRTAAELIGRNRAEFFPAEIVRQQQVLLDSVLIRREMAMGEWRVPFHDGERWVETRIVPLLAEDGQMDQVIAISRDLTEQRTLQDEVLKISTEERQRIGYDLHDGLGQHLSGIAFMAKALQNDLEQQVPEGGQKMGKIVELINQAIAQTRSMARLLAPVDVEANGLLVALKRLAADAQRLFRATVTVASNPAEFPVAIEASTIIYRITQEAIHNAIRHGAAKNVEVRLALADGLLQLTIRDDGKGFSLSRPQAASMSGMGRRIMDYRAKSVGGSTSMVSEPGSGCTVTCVFPMEFIEDVWRPKTQNGRPKNSGSPLPRNGQNSDF